MEQKRVCLSLRGWDWRRDEGAEAAEIAAGLIEAGTVDVGLVDGWRPRSASVGAAGLEVGPVHPWRRLLGRPPDVLVVFFPFPLVQVVVAWLLRLRGTRVVLVPMAWLGRDFATSSWFREGSRPRLWAKARLRTVLHRVWLSLADVFVCASDHERAQADLPVDRTVLLPLPTPVSPLVESLVRGSLDLRPDPAGAPRDRPLALIARFDVHRKGIDRVCRWLEACRDELPRPAVLLLAPATEEPPRAVSRLCADGLIEWDQRSTGADLAGPLGRCRGVILLTRYEGYPRVLREAALAGLPIVTTLSANFAETIELLSEHERQAGYVIDGDDPRKVQAAFTALGDAHPAAKRAWAVLDRGRIGTFLADVLQAVAEGRPIEERSYYAWAARHAAALSGGS